MLLRKRGDILTGGGRDPLTVTLDTNTRQGDLADQATGNNEVHIQLKLKQTDAKILQAIEEALERIQKGHLRRVPRLRRAHCRGAAERDPLDARLHHLQGETEFVTPAELLALLQEFYRETLELFNARQSNARSVAAYDANNGYQQVLGRQDVHLRWLADAIAGARRNAPRRCRIQRRSRGRATATAARSLIESDARSQQAFIERWTPRVAAR